MTVEAFWKAFEMRFGIKPFAPGQYNTVLCTDANQTQYAIPDPRILPNDAARLAVFEDIAPDIGTYVIPS